MKKILLTILILSMIFTTACWDMIELEDRILPYSVGIDIGAAESDKPLFFCFSYPNINAIGKSKTQDQLVYLINVNANSIFEATNEISSRIHNPVHLKHLNVVVMSEEVFTNDTYVREVIDGIQRDFVMNKMLNLLITRGTAHELLTKKLESKQQETIEGLLTTLLMNEQESTKFTPIKVMDFINDMDNRIVSIVPLATPNGEIEIAGGGLFKDYKFLGYIGENDNRNILILNDKLTTADLDVDFNGIDLSILLTKFNTKKRLVNKEELKIQYDINIDGQIQQHIIDESTQITSSGIIEDMEDTINRYIESELSKTIETLQKEHNADVLGLLEYLNRFHPKIYKEVEKDWDTIFPDLDIDVNVNITIRRRGLST
ncbi:MAG: Ger(x)C family spore germination protein [Tissierellaceae bacterium]|nr:Ger(x)C family spore germination protein [Tissierellaceae bacterium]